MSKAQRLPCKMTMKATKTGSHRLKPSHRYCAARLSHRTTFHTHAMMSQSAAPATDFCSTPHRHADSAIIGNGRRRLQTIADTKAASSEHLSTPTHPQTSKVKREPFATRSGTTYARLKCLESKSTVCSRSMIPQSWLSLTSGIERLHVLHVLHMHLLLIPTRLPRHLKSTTPWSPEPGAVRRTAQKPTRAGH